MNTSLRYGRRLLAGALLVLPLLGGVSTASAERRPEGGPHMSAPREEPLRAPWGYTRMERPRELGNARPAFREDYRHNFRADHAFRIGPYHPPVGYAYQRWHYGQILPRPTGSATISSTTSGCSAWTCRRWALNGCAMGPMRC